LLLGSFFMLGFRPRLPDLFLIFGRGFPLIHYCKPQLPQNVVSLPSLLVPFPVDLLKEMKVGPAVNKVANDRPEYLAPAPRSDITPIDVSDERSGRRVVTDVRSTGQHNCLAIDCVLGERYFDHWP
jgi:hypothetical protein